MGLLVAGFNFSPVAEDEFNDWYDTEHIPERERVKGFVNCERWIGAEDPKISIATYDLESLAVLQTPAYRAIAGANLSPWSKRVTGKCRRICRFEAEQTLPGNQAAPASGATAMLFFAMNPVPEAEADFNAWYNEEHVPALAAVPGCLTAKDAKPRRKNVWEFELEDTQKIEKVPLYAGPFPDRREVMIQCGLVSLLCFFDFEF